MKITAAFKPHELFGVMGFLLSSAGLVTFFAHALLFKTADFLWLPFLLVLLLLGAKYFKQVIPTSIHGHATSGYMLALKITFAFLLTCAVYFGFGQGLLLNQLISYDVNGQPVVAQILNAAQLLWAFKLTLMSWVVAASLALAMTLTGKQRISEFFPAHAPPRYALVIDSIIVFCFMTVIFIFFAVGSVELARSIPAFLGFERPIFPELTAFILTLALLSGYFLFGIKKRLDRLAKKTVSLGMMLTLQVIWVVVLLLIGQGAILFFPMQMILPIMKPVLNIFTHIDYTYIWMFVTLAGAIMSAPFLARYLARSMLGLPVWQVLLGLFLVPGLIGIGLFYRLPAGLLINTVWVPITVENVIYQLAGAQVALLGSMVVLLLCFWRSHALQQAWVDLMPAHIGQRLRRLRSIVAKQSLLLILLVIFYLFLANYGYYFLMAILLVPATVALLWVSLTLLYNLIIH